MNEPQNMQNLSNATEASVKLSLANWNLLLAGVAELPWKVADPMMKEVNRQIMAQLEPQSRPPMPPPGPLRSDLENSVELRGHPARP